MSVQPVSSGQRDLGRIPLYLVESEKSVEQSPGRIALGLIRLRGWQLRRLAAVPADLPDRAAYLVRVRYEFDISPGVTPPRWAEVRFDFPDPDVLVLDAVPTRVVEPARAASYRLTPELRFAAVESGTGTGADVTLPALVPEIVPVGIDSALIGWRHVGQVPPGTHVGWLVLLVPESWTEVPVLATGHYHVETAAELQLRPDARQDAFTVRLPAPVVKEPAVQESAVPEPAPRESAAPVAGTCGGPRVFVSYAQESDAHKAAVAELCELLEKKGLDVRFDQQHLDERRDWDRWTTTQIQRSDYVLVIASPGYRDAANGELPEGERRGVISEYVRLTDQLHHSRAQWTKKILPVVLPGRSPQEIPLSFQPSTCDYYLVDSITDQGADSLLRVLLRGTVA